MTSFFHAKKATFQEKVTSKQERCGKARFASHYYLYVKVVLLASHLPESMHYVQPQFF